MNGTPSQENSAGSVLSHMRCLSPLTLGGASGQSQHGGLPSPPSLRRSHAGAFAVSQSGYDSPIAISSDSDRASPPGTPRKVAKPIARRQVNPSKHRGFCFTLNNPLEGDIDTICDLGPRYLIVGKEYAPTTGTPHLQGYIYFTNPRSFIAVATAFPRWHIMIANGTPLENFTYCSKGGDFVEFPDHDALPRSREQLGQMERDRWDLVWYHAARGEWEMIPADLRIRYVIVYYLSYLGKILSLWNFVYIILKLGYLSLALLLSLPRYADLIVSLAVASRSAY